VLLPAVTCLHHVTHATDAGEAMPDARAPQPMRGLHHRRDSQTSEAQRDPAPDGAGLRQRIGLLAGPMVMLVMLLLPAPGDIGEAAWRTAAVGVLMAIWWVSEALPIAATALVPLALFPLLGILPMRATAAPYANPLIFLFLGGFIIALAMQRWGLHRRLALLVVRAVGTKPHRLVLGMMVASAFVSMWVSNTATTVMMLPIGLSVILLVRPDAEYGPDAPVDFNFAVCLMLGIAYASSIGGLATLIGTPPNALLAAFMLETYGVEVGFAQWMTIGVPLVVVTLPLAWLLLTRVAFPIRITEIPGGAAAIAGEYARLGVMSRGEKWVALVFAGAAISWIARPLIESYIPGLTDTGIAIIAALTLFAIPLDARMSTFVMDWRTAEKLPWGVLLLFGGGLALADAVTASGLAESIAGAIGGISALPAVVLLVTVTVVVILLTELTSNTATAAAFLPLIAALAIGLGENPLLLVVPAALAASCAFMMPVATPPNAIVYGSGYVTIPQMVRAGWMLNVLFAIAITALMYTLVGMAFGIEPGVVPGWATGR
jgi:solute carrier family 13 (sodium-dependent dicarboxylate transporter), member 2/3/5